LSTGVHTDFARGFQFIAENLLASLTAAFCIKQKVAFASCIKSPVTVNYEKFFVIIVDWPNLKKLGPDLNWLIRGGVDPVNFIRTYGSKMVYMHIRDQRQDGKWTEYIGEGITDFPAIAEALKEIDFKGEAAIELASDVPPQNPMKENWKDSRVYVRKVFGW
jgi:hypothetical protein